MENVKVVNASNFKEEVLDSAVPVLVDFWATWCGPCKSLAPTLEKFAATANGKFKVVKIDVDQNQELGAQYSVRGIPYLLVFKDGQVQTTATGNKTMDQLTKLVETALPKTDDFSMDESF